MPISDVFFSRKKEIVFHLLKYYLLKFKKELLYFPTPDILIVCLTRFKMKNKQKDENSNHQLFKTSSILGTLFNWYKYISLETEVILYLAYFLTGFGFFGGFFGCFFFLRGLLVIVNGNTKQFSIVSASVSLADNSPLVMFLFCLFPGSFTL